MTTRQDIGGDPVVLRVARLLAEAPPLTDQQIQALVPVVAGARRALRPTRRRAA